MELQNLPTPREAAAFVRELEAVEKLYIILLAGAIIRSPFFFVNLDSNVYHLWLEFFSASGQLPYYDHPPAFFFLSSIFTEGFSFLQGLNPYLYWYLLVPVFGGVYYVARDRSPFLFIFVSYTVLYTFLVGYLGNFHELAVLASFLSGLAFIYLSYRIGELRSESTGLYAALFTAVSWWPVVYSKVLLIDMFAATVIVAAYLQYYRFIRTESPSRWSWVTTTLLLALAFYSKYYALLLVPAIGIYAVYRIRGVRELAEKAVPGVVAVSFFGLWAVYTDFYFLSHYASTHYLFLTLPSPLAFGRFLWAVLTPLFSLLFLAGVYYLYRADRDFTAFLLLPFVLTLGFHVFQVYVSARSHSLINLSNYMLYTFPMVAVVVAEAWRRIGSDFRYGDVLVLVIALSFALPLSSSSIGLEYDERYSAPPPSNLNTLTSSEFVEMGLEDVSGFHFAYSFNRETMLWGEHDAKEAHFRWMAPDSFRVIAVEPVEYRLTFRPRRDAEAYLLREGEAIERLSPGVAQNVTIRVAEGITGYSVSSTEETPFVVTKTRVS